MQLQMQVRIERKMDGEKRRCHEGIGVRGLADSRNRFHTFAHGSCYLDRPFIRKVLPSAKTEVSRDGNALVVHRSMSLTRGHPLWGMEDFCALLGLRPAAKYETTWERIA